MTRSGNHKRNNVFPINVCELSHGNTNLGTILMDLGIAETSVRDAESELASLEAIGRKHSEFLDPSH